MNLTKTSKFLSLILRHKPDKIGITLDSAGWANVSDLLLKSKIDRNVLNQIVETCDKQRFEFNSDQTKIRARQGHSIKVDLGYVPATPPDVLYHGTATKFLDDIYASGLQKMNRHAVHLSADVETASNVGARHGKLVVFKINAKQMFLDGKEFFVTENKVWLTDAVEPKYFLKE